MGRARHAEIRAGQGRNGQMEAGRAATKSSLEEYLSETFINNKTQYL